MRSRTSLALLAGLIVSSCGPTVRTTAPSTGPSASARDPATSPTPTAATLATQSPPSSSVSSPIAVLDCDRLVSRGALVAYRDADDLWLYDAAANASRRLTNDGGARIEWSPAFVDSGCLAHAVWTETAGSAIELLQLSTGGAGRTLAAETGSIVTLAVRPDATDVVYMHIDHDVDSTYRLKRVRLDGGTTDLLHTFEPNLGRGASSEDEISVAWSPDGTAILVANTHEYSEAFPAGSIYLLGADGRVRHRWAGTHPRWSADGRSIFYREHASVEVDGQEWHRMDIESLEPTRVDARPGANGAAIAPDGRFIAYDTAYFGDLPIGVAATGEVPAAYVYDLATGRERRLRRDAMQAIWIDETTLLVTNVGPPPPDSLNSWASLGTVTMVTIDGDSAPVDMTSTLFDSAVLPRD